MPEKNQTAVMCHNIAKYNREHQQPDLTPLKAAERLEEDRNIYHCNQCAYNGLADCKGSCVKTTPYDTAISYLRAIAAGEYKPVIHARWVQKGNQWPTCTNCGKPTLSRGYCPAYSDVCPSCGAIMDGKDKEE